MASVPDITPEVETLYAPQFEQLGIALRPCGFGLYGRTVTNLGAGYGWVAPVGKHCLIMEHCASCAHDTDLVEYAPAPYACVSSVSAASAVCMPKSGISAHKLAAPQAASTARSGHVIDGIYSFVNDTRGSLVSPLTAGQVYRSRCIIFLPGFFRELETRYGSDFSGLFDAFDTRWNEPAAHAIRTALEHIGPGRACAPGAGLYMPAAVDTLVAELAASRVADAHAAAAQQTHASVSLTKQAMRAVEHALDTGRAPCIEEVAASLYVSRSHLCAVFKQETGEGLGAFIRRRRCERAQELLADGMPVGEVSARLGYPSQTAFSHAFKQTCGQSASDWRTMVQAGSR